MKVKEKVVKRLEITFSDLFQGFEPEVKSNLTFVLELRYLSVHTDIK